MHAPERPRRTAARRLRTGCPGDSQDHHGRRQYDLPRRYCTSPIRPDYHDRMVTGAPASVFISYSHADKDLARALAAVLQDRGVRIWIDEGELKVGDSIIERIATAIAEIDFSWCSCRSHRTVLTGAGRSSHLRSAASSAAKALTLSFQRG